MTRLRRPLVLALACVFAALSVGVLAACGSSDDSQSASDVLADTFGPGKKISSGQLNVSVAIRPKTGKPTTLALTGPFQSQGAGKLPQFALALTADVSGQSLSAGVTSTGTKGYVTIDGTAYELSDEAYAQFTKGYENAQSQAKAKAKGGSAPTLQKLGIDPRGWLTGAKIVGHEDVGGAKTIHITAGVSVPKLVDDISTLLSKAGSLDLGGTTAGQAVPKSLTPSQKASIEKALTSVKVDVFTGKDDKTLRRVVLVLGLKAPDGQSVGGFTAGTVTISVTISDLNQPQTIAAPPNAKPFSDLQSQLQGLLGGLSGSGSGSSGAADPGAASKYLECVQKAGSDLAEVQACAKLVGQ